jgi:hypothetical protein
LNFQRDLRTATTPVDAATVASLIEVVRRFWPLLQRDPRRVLTPLEFDSAAMAAYAIAEAERMPMRVFSSYDDAVE